MKTVYDKLSQVLRTETPSHGRVDILPLRLRIESYKTPCNLLYYVRFTIFVTTGVLHELFVTNDYHNNNPPWSIFTVKTFSLH